jgi:hypothetical protein
MAAQAHVFHCGGGRKQSVWFGAGVEAEAAPVAILEVHHDWRQP